MPERPPAVVTVAPAIARDVPVYLSEIGKMVAVEVVSIVPQVGGKVTAVHIEDGAYVRKGDLLFEIDPRPFDAALASARAQVAQTRAELDWAQVEFRRVQGLMNTASASQLEYDQKRVALAVAEARVAAATAAVQTAELDVEYSRIYSPITGRAGARLVDAGNVVRANDAPLMVIQRLDPIYVEFTVPENELEMVRRHLTRAGLGDDPQGKLKVLVQVPSEARATPAAAATAHHAPPVGTQPAHAGGREGRLTFLDNSVNARAGTVRLRATVPNEDRYFWPGQFVNVRLVLTTRENTVLVPAQAQQIGQQGPFVYVVRPDGTAELRAVKVGQRQGDLLGIEEGVEAGEPVVVSGQMMVIPGARVMVANAPPATAPAGAQVSAAAP